MTKPSLSVIILTRQFTSELEKKIQLFPGWLEGILVIEDQEGRGIRQSGPVKIIVHKLRGDYSSQRNWALKLSKSEWTLFLDDDEIPSNNFFPKLWDILNKKSWSAIEISRDQMFLGCRLHFGDGGGQRLVRIAKTRLGQKKWQGKIHETWNVPGHRFVSELTIEHHNEASLSNFFQRLHEYAQVDAQERGNIPISHLLVELAFFPAAKFLVNYFFKAGWRDHFPGFVHAWCMSYYSAIVRIYQYENSLR